MKNIKSREVLTNVKNKKFLQFIEYIACLFCVLVLGFYIIEASTDSISVNGIVHVEGNQQYVSINPFELYAGDYKLPEKFENQFSDGTPVLCTFSTFDVSTNLYDGDDRVYYKLVDVTED